VFIVLRNCSGSVISVVSQLSHSPLRARRPEGRLLRLAQSITHADTIGQCGTGETGGTTRSGSAKRTARATREARHKAVAAAHGLQSMSDEELIAPARTSLSHPHHEMEMQRRLRDSILALTLETCRSRWWALWGTVAIGLLTAVLIVLTVVLAMKG